MLWQVPASKLYYRVCRFVLFFLAAAASFNGFYDNCHFHEVGVPRGWNVDGFEQMVDGTAERPYIYRQLLPTTANWIDRIVPETVKTRLYNYQGRSPDAYISSMALSPAANNRKYFFRYLATYIATFLFALTAVYAMYFVCNVLAVPRPAAVFAPVILILVLPYIMNDSGFDYDYPELAFMALAVWVSLKFDWWWGIPVAALGTWNKESFLLFVPTLYPLIRRRRSRLEALLGIAALCSICAAVYLPIHLRFAHNAGSTVVVQWRDQLQSIAHPRMLLFTTEQVYGLRLPKAFTLIPMALLFWTIWRGWRHLPSSIQRHGQIAAAINIPLYLLFCSPGELRDLSMLYVVLLLVVAANLSEWIAGGDVNSDAGRMLVDPEAG